MSRQAEDLLVRTLKDASSLFEKERYKKPSKNLIKPKEWRKKQRGRTSCAGSCCKKEQ
jgi:hypothetical protein